MKSLTFTDALRLWPQLERALEIAKHSETITISLHGDYKGFEADKQFIIAHIGHYNPNGTIRVGLHQVDVDQIQTNLPGGSSQTLLKMAFDHLEFSLADYNAIAEIVNAIMKMNGNQFKIEYLAEAIHYRSII